MIALRSRVKRSDGVREGVNAKAIREFALRGNVVDLAVGIIIGAAFGAIVNSLVADLIMPIIGAVTGGARLLELLLRRCRKR